MRSSLFAAAALLLAATLVGCGRTYTWNGQSFSSAEDAKEAAHSQMVADVSGVKQVSPRLGGRVLVVLPTRTIYEANGIRVGSGIVNPDSVAFVVDIVEADALHVVDAVRQARIFDDVVLLRSDDPPGALFDTYDYKLWDFGAAPTQWQWYLARRGAPDRLPVSFDQGLTHSEKLNAFMRTIVDTGQRLGGMPRVSSRH